MWFSIILVRPSPAALIGGGIARGIEWLFVDRRRAGPNCAVMMCYLINTRTYTRVQRER